eukprot:CAMPEP_0119317938 /NCGR_PEP_ID=MMETSP1333-20130426/44929_1 /TAXON_ID=418940 /ORGANISM="Scyphosphaera apsteinii, Strain RCC1455" /LENGTH=238 /DNA_ID=CAMNT_0007324017 /DNA_START=47 /DNA_END=763 /DNA_ORIENTATION=+
MPRNPYYDYADPSEYTVPKPPPPPKDEPPPEMDKKLKQLVETQGEGPHGPLPKAIDLDAIGRKWTSDTGPRYATWGDKYVVKTGSSQGQKEVHFVEGGEGAAVYFAAVEGEASDLLTALQNGGNPSWTDEEGMQPLHAACRHGHAECVKMLLAMGADINGITRTAWTPLITAAYWGNLECVQALLSNGAELHLKGTHRLREQRLTAKQFAEAYGNEACAAMLKSAELRESMKSGSRRK